MLKRFFFPNVCGFCGQIIKYGHICNNCINEIEYLGFKYIPYNQNMKFDELHCNYLYEGIVRKRMLDYKFRHKKYLCKMFAEGIICGIQNMKSNFDMIIPVPIHKDRLMERGYNQSSLIANIISKQTGIVCRKDILVKVNKNKMQSKLTKEERIKNVKGIFDIRNGFVLKGKTVLLIDDIYTTGATANECSRVLKRAGATKVIVYTVAKATVNSHID